MSENTKIEWCDHSWSPWRGCTKVSSGCAHCYAEGLSRRFGDKWGGWGKGNPRVLAKDWRSPVRWNEEAEWNNKLASIRIENFPSASANDWDVSRPRVFPSLCDPFDEEVPIEWLARFLQLIHDTPNLDWLLLTKRPELWHNRLLAAIRYNEDSGGGLDVHRWMVDWIAPGNNGPSNVRIGTSVEDQPRADERIPALLKIPARRRFLSVEPMLEPVDLSMWLPNGEADGDTTAKHNYEHPEDSIHWVIVGGESGPGSRPCNVDWVRSIVAQCAASGVPCFVKQLGAHPIGRWTESPDKSGLGEGWPAGLKINHPKGGDPAEWPEDLRVRQFPEVQP